MRILLLGSGGREHALAWKIAQSARCEKLYVAPGNAGTSMVGENVAVSATDFAAVKQFCLAQDVAMVVVGPEEPLVRGIVDAFRDDSSTAHIAVVGPSRVAAQIEGSKDYAKAFMQCHAIPTARYMAVEAQNIADGMAFLSSLAAPYVLKADGLCAGKGVLIVDTLAAAQQALRDMVGGMFGQASQRVVVEEYLSGVECSVFVLTDGTDYKVLPMAKDYKRVGEGNTGPNTGGMGAVSPVPFATAAWMDKVEQRIIRPTIAGLSADGTPYKGFIFFGLIDVAGEPMVIEYNCRLGDPETEVVLLRVESDMVDLLEAVAKGTLREKEIAIDPRYATCVVVVSGGYPSSYAKGCPIRGLTAVEESIVFHAGTAERNGEIVTSGGRVLAVSAYGDSKEEALRHCYADVARLSFDGMYYRDDIGFDI